MQAGQEMKASRFVFVERFLLSCTAKPRPLYFSAQCAVGPQRGAVSYVHCSVSTLINKDLYTLSLPL